MQSIRLMEKQIARLMLMLIGFSIILAMLSRGLTVSLPTTIPVANFYDRVSGTSANGIYFIGMYIASAALLPTVITAFRLLIRADISLDKRLLCALVFFSAFAFCAYLCVFMPATTVIGGGRFSMLLAASAEWPFAYGLIYGLLFYIGVTFLGLSLAAAAGRNSQTTGHT